MGVRWAETVWNGSSTVHSKQSVCGASIKTFLRIPFFLIRTRELGPANVCFEDTACSRLTKKKIKACLTATEVPQPDHDRVDKW